MLSNRIVIYVPHGDLPKNTVDWALQKTKKFLAMQFGGYTAFQADGGWMGQNGELIEEEVTVVVAFTDKSFQSCWDNVTNYCKIMANLLDQECIAVEFNYTMHLIYPVKEESKNVSK